MTTKSYRRSAAFTLIELLVVVGLIALLAGIIGMAMKGGDSATALKGAQSTIFSLVASTRGQAILNQTTARLVVYANPSATDTVHNLNYLQVVYQLTVSGTNYWVAPSDGVALPTGVYVVPASPTVSSITSNYTAVSQLLPGGSATSMTIYGPPATQGAAPTAVVANNMPCYYIEFNQLGTPTTTGSGYGTLAISTGARASATATAPTFNNSQNVRGLMLTQLGTPILLNSTADFP